MEPSYTPTPKPSGDTPTFRFAGVFPAGPISSQLPPDVVDGVAVNARELLSVAVTAIGRNAGGALFTGTTKSSVCGLTLNSGLSETFNTTFNVGFVGGAGVT